MNRSFILVFFYNLFICFVTSKSFFCFDEIAIKFVRSLNNETFNQYDQPLRYLNWFIPFIIPVLICSIRAFRFSLHQSFIYNLVSLFFMNIIFYVLEFVHLYDESINLNVILVKIWFLQIIHTFIQSIIYWINFISLISHFKNNEVLLVTSCYILTTVFADLVLDFFTYKSFFFTFQLVTILMLVIHYMFYKAKINIKDDFKVLPTLNFRIHILKRSIVLSSLLESFCIGGLLFLYLLPYFGLFLLTFIPVQNQELFKLFFKQLNSITYFPFLIGLTFGLFLLSTFANFNIKKTIWSMFAKNLLFIYVWSVIFNSKIPFEFRDGLMYFAISINILIQISTVLENLRTEIDEESETITLLTPGILSIGIILNWIIFTILLGLKIYLDNQVFAEVQIYYLYSIFLIGLFLASFNHIIKDNYVSMPVIRIESNLV